MTVLGRPAGIKSVQRGYTTITGLTASATISAVTLSKTFVTASFSGPNAIDMTSCAVRLTSSTNLSISRTDGTSSANIAWEVVEFE